VHRAPDDSLQRRALIWGGGKNAPVAEVRPRELRLEQAMLCTRREESRREESRQGMLVREGMHPPAWA